MIIKNKIKDIFIEVKHHKNQLIVKRIQNKKRLEFNITENGNLSLKCIYFYNTKFDTLYDKNRIFYVGSIDHDVIEHLRTLEPIN